MAMSMVVCMVMTVMILSSCAMVVVHVRQRVEEHVAQKASDCERDKVPSHTLPGLFVAHEQAVEPKDHENRHNRDEYRAQESLRKLGEWLHEGVESLHEEVSLGHPEQVDYCADIWVF